MTAFNLYGNVYANHFEKPITISTKDFQLNKYWIWTYYTQGDKNMVSSIEKYLVTKKRGSLVSIEMSSQLEGESEFKTHHKFKLNISSCLSAYKNKYQTRSIPLKMYYKLDNEWIKLPHIGRTSVFEEKFNCNGLVDDGYKFFTVFDRFSSWQVVRQIPKAKKSGVFPSYYSNQSDYHPGVALFKSFNPGTSSHYTFELTEVGG